MLFIRKNWNMAVNLLKIGRPMRMQPCKLHPPWQFIFIFCSIIFLNKSIKKFQFTFFVKFFCLFELYVCVCTSRRRCCVCSGVSRRWERSVSVPCSLATAAWRRGGTAHHVETGKAAPCTPPASHDPPPSPWPRHLDHTHTHHIRIFSISRWDILYQLN